VNAADEYGDVTDRHTVVHVRTNYLLGIVEVAEVLPGPVMATVNASLAQLGEETIAIRLLDRRTKAAARGLADSVRP